MSGFKLHEAFAGEGEDSQGSGDGGSSGDSGVGAEHYKQKGNEAFAAKNWDEAITNYNKAIQLDPKQAAFYSNRAACWSSKGNHDSALADAKRCLEVDPKFVKGYSRKGKALFDMGKLDDAQEAYKTGLAIDNSNTGCSSGLRDVEVAKKAAAAAANRTSGLGGLGGIGQKLLSGIRSGGMGSRLKMYGVVALGYMMLNKFTGGDRSGSPSPSAGAEEPEDQPIEEHMPWDPPPPPMVGGLNRTFGLVGGSWFSYLEAGDKAESLLVCLHRTALSAETEFRPMLDTVLEKAAKPPPGGLRILAPDRPCHGFTACVPKMGRTISTWVEAFLAREPRKPKLKTMTILASGRRAAREAFGVARNRELPTRLLIIDPRAKGPSRQLYAGRLLDPVGFQEILDWLKSESIAAPSALGDTVRWLASNATKAKMDDGRSEGWALPEGSQVVVLYTSGQKEDVDMKESLDGSGIDVRVRRLEAGNAEATASAVASEVWSLIMKGHAMSAGA